MGEADDAAEAGRSKAQMYLVVSNIKGKANVGMLIRVACAFGCEEVIVAGERNIREHAAHGASKHVHVRWQPTLQDAAEFLRSSRAVTRIYGLEITPTAQYVHTWPFMPFEHSALLVGNEGDGLSAQQRSLCSDGFLQIAQHGHGTASLPVVVAASIALHHFALFADKPEAEVDYASEKYTLPSADTANPASATDATLRQRPLGRAGETPSCVRARRAHCAHNVEQVDLSATDDLLGL